MSFDYKKAYKELYLPKNKPEIIDIPEMNFIAISGKGDPNEEAGAYKQAIEALYSIAYTIKMSYKTEHEIKGYFEYVVPPLEGLWWIDDLKGIDYSRKDLFSWITMIRLPDFVEEADVLWAVENASIKKKHDFSAVEFFTYNEGLVVQMMHLGPYDDEPGTVAIMEQHVEDSGYALDFSNRYHHEIYLSDPRKVVGAKLKTIIRHPIKPLDK